MATLQAAVVIDLAEHGELWEDSYNTLLAKSESTSLGRRLLGLSSD